MQKGNVSHIDNYCNLKGNKYEYNKRKNSRTLKTKNRRRITSCNGAIHL